MSSSKKINTTFSSPQLDAFAPIISPAIMDNKNSIILPLQTRLNINTFPLPYSSNGPFNSSLYSSFNQIYVISKNARFCWIFTWIILCIALFSASLGGFYIINSPHNTSTRNLDRKYIQLFSLSLSIAGGLLVVCTHFLSSTFRSFTFLGVFELCWTRLVMDTLRWAMIIIDFRHHFGNHCQHMLLIFTCFQLASIWFIASVPINLVLCTNAYGQKNPRKTFHPKKKMIDFFIWFVSGISAIVICYPHYLKSEKDLQETFTKSKYTDGTCFTNYGTHFSYIGLPSLVLLISLIAMFIFRKRVRDLYPRSAFKLLSCRIYTYIISWFIIVLLLVLLLKVLCGKIRTQYRFLLAMIFCLYDLLGFLYAFITLREFISYSGRIESSYHLQNVQMNDVDYGSIPVVLGEGTYAVVFKATWKSMQVAVKVFKFAYVNKEQMRMEAYLASQLSHPNLVTTYGCGLVDDNNIAIVTEYVDGGTLAALIDTCECTYHDVLNYGIQIAKAMEFLHNRNPPIVHRDLKPSNCFINRYHTIIKVADFGCSRWIENEAEIRQRRRSSLSLSSPAKSSYHSRLMTSNVGTPCWTAPELMTDTDVAPYSLKVDVFSFGIILWQLYTGKMPYEEVQGSLVALEGKVVQGYRPEIPKDCPCILAELIRYCWHSDPIKRPSFTEIKKVLLNELLKYEKLEDLEPIALDIGPSSNNNKY